VARRRKTDPTILETLRRWWSEKYRLPSNHELFQHSTLFELLADFWEDYYFKNPLEAHRNEKGEVQFSHTGDELIDKWEKELSEGKSPDYLEGFSPEELEKLEKLRTRGTTKFGKSIPQPANTTLKQTADTVSAEALQQGLADPAKRPRVYKRFSDHDSDE
jgi:hypothetical protein